MRESVLIGTTRRVDVDYSIRSISDSNQYSPDVRVKFRSERRSEING